MYVIAGVSGNTGSIVADALLEQGKKVRVVVREATKGEHWKARGAEVAVATLDDEAALTKALAGATGAYLLSPPDGGSSDFIAQRRKTFDTVARAVNASKVPHVVLLSSVGAQHAEGTGPIRTLHDAEQQLVKTNAKTTFVRAAYFLENWGSGLAGAAQGKLPSFLPADLAIPMVATKDIGLTAAKALLEPPAGQSDVIELVGPRDYSARDVAAVLAKIHGRTVEVEAAPVEVIASVLTGFGLSPDAAGLLQEMYGGIAKGRVDYDGKGRRVRGSIDAEAVFRGLGAGAK